MGNRESGTPSPHEGTDIPGVGIVSKAPEGRLLRIRSQIRVGQEWLRQRRGDPKFWGTTAGVLSGVSFIAKGVANEVHHTHPLVSTVFRGIAYASTGAGGGSGITAVFIWEKNFIEPKLEKFDAWRNRRKLQPPK